VHLFKLFSQYCYKPQSLSDPLRAKFVPRANDFSDFAEYFVRKVNSAFLKSDLLLVSSRTSQSIVTAIAEYRDAEGKSGHTVRRFLIDQLRYNDNSKNSVRSTSRLELVSLI
jgi:transcription initiation factor TFIID subunit 2